MEGVMKSMMLTKLTKAIVAGLLVLSLCGLGIGGGSLLSIRTMAQQPEAPSDGTGPVRSPKTDMPPVPPPPSRAVVKPPAENPKGDKGDDLAAMAAFYERTGHPNVAAFLRQMAEKRVKQETGGKTDAGAKHDTAKSDLDRLQGVWSVFWYERGGERYKADNIVFMVDGKRACWQTKDSETQGGIYLDPTSKPRTFDFATSTRTMEGIYSLEGDTLELCYDAGNEPKRPGGFLTEKGSRQVHLGFKRIHGPEAFPFRLPDGTRAFPTIIERATTPLPPPRVMAQPKDTKPDANRAEERPARVGKIFVVGNTRTETSVILKKIPLFPGTVLDYQALRTAEKNLATLNPTITVLDGGDPNFKDIQVKVEEEK
jgi:uncharacterized protein (TIGR03067 family)